MTTVALEKVVLKPQDMFTPHYTNRKTSINCFGCGRAIFTTSHSCLHNEISNKVFGVLALKKSTWIDTTTMFKVYALIYHENRKLFVSQKTFDLNFIFVKVPFHGNVMLRTNNFPEKYNENDFINQIPVKVAINTKKDVLYESVLM